mmetsp:Transcript_24789/g.72623  ORF Transcript_24789/g.72623 Transcript_24789/m.72623 type:complete len:94 (+) Transcript_24789:1241-1522(+)
MGRDQDDKYGRREDYYRVAETDVLIPPLPRDVRVKTVGVLILIKRFQRKVEIIINYCNPRKVYEGFKSSATLYNGRRTHLPRLSCLRMRSYMH